MAPIHAVPDMPANEQKTPDRPVPLVKVFFAAFLLLLMANVSVLQDPPYWDALTGIFSQAVWLKDHNFDYMSLWQQPKWTDGGPRVNILYLLAPAYGLLLKLFDPAWAFGIIHGFNIFCGALTFTLFYAILCDFIPHRHALLWCLAAALDPIWNGQVASLYIEMPQAACYGAVILALHRHGYIRAAIACVLAFLIKSSALLLALAMVVWYGVQYIGRHWPASLPRPAPGHWRAVFTVLPFPVVYLLSTAFTSDRYQLQWHVSRSLFIIKTQIPFQTLTLMGIALALIAVLLKRKWRRQVFGDRAAFDMVTFLTILVGGFWVAFHLYPLSLCRYVTSIVFPMTALLGLLVSRLGSRVPVLLAGMLIITGAANLYGLLLPPLPGPKARSGEYLERSREYLIDLAANRRICRFLEDHHFTRPIVVKYPFAHMLTDPDLGYVRQPLPNIHVAGRRPIFTAARAYEPAISSRASTLYLYAPNVFEYFTRPSLMPDPNAEIIYVDTALGASIVVYRRPVGRSP